MQQEDPIARTLCRTKEKGFEPRLWPGKARRKMETPILAAGQWGLPRPRQAGEEPLSLRRSAAPPTPSFGLQSCQVTGFFLATKLIVAEKKLDAVVNVYLQI